MPDGTRNLCGNILSASLAGMVQPATFNTLDVLRLRWQSSMEPRAIVAFARAVAVEEGVWRGLWRPGFGANVAAVSTSQGLRMGFYPSVRDVFAPPHGGKQPSAMFFSGLLCGSLAYLISAPLWLLKTRAQASAELSPPAPLLWRRDLLPPTLRGYWKGASALVVRGALMTAGQMLGYDATKTLLKSRDVRDSPVLHVVAATVAALTAATLAAPADALQTRYQSSLGTGAASTESVHECARRMLLREGPRVFFRGWTAQFIRLVGTFTLGTTVYEQTRRLLGLGFLD